MKGKINVKTIVILVVVLVVIVLGVLGMRTVRTFMSGATSDLEPSGVTAVSAADGKTATVSWTSNKASLAKVEYGTTAASLVLMATENESVISHKVSLTSLKPNTTYYYRIRIGEEVFDNSGIPWTFKTKGEGDATATPTAIVSPTVSSVPLASSSATECKTGVDYNNDGVINSFDLSTCKNNGGQVSSLTSSLTTTTTPTKTISKCDGTVADYNSDGIVNSLDRVNCLQSQN